MCQAPCGGPHTRASLGLRVEAKNRDGRAGWARLHCGTGHPPIVRLQPALACLPAHSTQHFLKESSQGNSSTNPTIRTSPGKGGPVVPGCEVGGVGGKHSAVTQLGGAQSMPPGSPRGWDFPPLQAGSLGTPPQAQCAPGRVWGSAW